MLKFITKKQQTLLIGLLIFLSVFFTGCSPISSNVNLSSSATNTSQNTANKQSPNIEQNETSDKNKLSITENGTYTSKKEVALYIHTYKKLPSNYITKKEARSLGWNSKKGNLWDVTDHKSIGGNRFGNYEKKLPDQNGRKYYECDIEYEGGYRNEKRIVYSNDGLIFYTEDHYQTFEKLYE